MATWCKIAENTADVYEISASWVAVPESLTTESRSDDFTGLGINALKMIGGLNGET
jgi:hypothetical protein